MYEGTRRSDGVAVAVKVMELSTTSRSNFVNVALEIEIMKSLNHPNIVNMQASWENDNETFLVCDTTQMLTLTPHLSPSTQVLDFCGGGELFKYMKKYDLSHMPSMAPRFVAEIVLALEYLREQKIVHRDLKPENILLTKDFHVKVADFGTACWADRDDEDANKFTGTDKYMAPELLQSTVPTKAGFESDLWALGCITYQLFCGKPPFQGVTSYLVFQSILHTELDYPPFVPEVAKDFIAKLLDHKPHERLGSEAKGGFDILKRHPFFKDVDWSQIWATSAESQIHKDHSAEWKKFLLDGEEVVFASEVVKTRHYFSKKDRHLVLTSYPRLFYVESLTSHQIKDHVLWTDDLAATAQTKKDFQVKTKDRTYLFEDKGDNAHYWVSKINEMHSRKMRTKY